jgi:CheY-like chemotaxis protein
VPAAPPPQPVRPRTILLVDDDALISMATSEMLKDLDHQVIAAPSATKALEILQAGAAVDLVITDQAMPAMTGAQLAAEIRGAWPDLPGHHRHRLRGAARGQGPQAAAAPQALWAGRSGCRDRQAAAGKTPSAPLIEPRADEGY